MESAVSLKNGNDIRGIALRRPDGAPVNLTPAIARRLAGAFCIWLEEQDPTLGRNPTIAIGTDSRLSGPALQDAVSEGVRERGNNVLLTGLSTTPEMFRILKDKKFGADASIMITASHLPYEWNGLKFMTKKGAIESSDLSRILQIEQEQTRKGVRDNPLNLRGSVRTPSPSYLDTYAGDLVRTVRDATGKEKPLSGLRILVDAGHGSGGFFASRVLEPLGADTTGSQFLNPDGKFPAHIPNPENKEAMASLQSAVLRNRADFGILFDTDVDRAGAVGPDGQAINRNRLIALISAILLEEKPGTIVTDSVTSTGLAEFIASRGGVHHRFKRGYKNVILEAQRLNQKGIYTPLAIETSGHAALLENGFLDDGAYLMVRLLIALAKQKEKGRALLDLISDLKEPREAIEIRPPFTPGIDFRAYGEKILTDFSAYVDRTPGLSPTPSNYEGVRVDFDRDHGDGWALLRLSLHEPVLPINIESDREGGAEIIRTIVFNFLSAYSELHL
ncbi:MAG: phosphomannomutase/phosphoglucomutase [Clostridia bacterium]|nr:phosphomannomutase/phosphoglucomutase [Clostridia bacterium]